MRVSLGCVGVGWRSDRLIDCSPAHAHAHQRRNAGLLHGDAVNRVGGLRRRAGIVSDDDELGVGLEAIEHPHEVADVLIVEWSIDFVEQTERTWLCEENPEQERERHERFLSARQQVNPLRAFATRRSMDLDVALERTGRILQSQVALAAAEQRHEDVAKVLAHLNEGLQKKLARGGIDLPYRLVQRRFRRVEIVALGCEELETLGFLVIFLDREWINRSERLELLAHQRRFREQHIVRHVERLRAGKQLFDGLSPLGLETLTDRGLPPGKLGVAKLRRMQLFAQRGAMPAQLRQSVIDSAQLLINLANELLCLGQSQLDISQCGESRIEVALPLRQLLRELRIRTRERGQLDLK